MSRPSALVAFNRLLSSCSSSLAAPAISSLDDCTAHLLVAVYEHLSGTRIPGVVRPAAVSSSTSPATFAPPANRAQLTRGTTIHNIQLLIEALRDDLVNIAQPCNTVSAADTDAALASLSFPITCALRVGNCFVLVRLLK
jgi:hypothetical protein